jgi:hypothetical protein
MPCVHAGPTRFSDLQTVRMPRHQPPTPPRAGPSIPPRRPRRSPPCAPCSPRSKVRTEGPRRVMGADRRHPSVAVWTADQLAAFLSSVNDDPLFALSWLAGLRGLRRGEFVRAAVERHRPRPRRADRRTQRTTAGHQVVEGDPKTPAGHRGRPGQTQRADPARASKPRAGPAGEAADNDRAWFDTGYAFTRRDGKPVNPNSSGTPASWLPPTPTPASCRKSSAAAPTPPPSWC